MNQIFKKEVPKHILYTLLDNICEKKQSVNCDANVYVYVLSGTSYKKAKFHNLIEPFCQILKPYYHISKQKYIMNMVRYTKLLTVIRQLCNSLHMSYTSKIVYGKSDYDIVYFIYRPYCNDE